MARGPRAESSKRGCFWNALEHHSSHAAMICNGDLAVQLDEGLTTVVGSCLFAVTDTSDRRDFAPGVFRPRSCSAGRYSPIWGIWPRSTAFRPRRKGSRKTFGRKVSPTILRDINAPASGINCRLQNARVRNDPMSIRSVIASGHAKVKGLNGCGNQPLMYPAA